MSILGVLSFSSKFYQYWCDTGVTPAVRFRISSVLSYEIYPIQTPKFTSFPLSTSSIGGNRQRRFLVSYYFHPSSASTGVTPAYAFVFPVYFQEKHNKML